MKIADVSAYSLSSTISPPRRYRFNGEIREIRKRDVILVSVETSDGMVGWAPCGTSTFTKWEEFNEATHDDIANAINNIVGPELTGATLDDLQDAHELVNATNLPQYLRWQARSVMDIALHDIKGKRVGAPIWEILDYDASPTPRLELYPSAGLYLTLDEYVEEASALVDRGYDAYKYRAGLGLERDREVIEQLRSVLGDDIKLMVDAHAWWSRDSASYSLSDVRSLIEHLGEYGVYWVEEPAPSSDYEAYRWLSETTGVPLAAGENEETPGSLVNMAELGDLTFFHGDVKKHGGFTGCRQAIDFAQENPVAFVPHNYGTQLGVVANAHLVAAAPGCNAVQYPIYQTDDHIGMYPFPLASDIITTDLDIEDGHLTVSDEPGLGVDINRDIIDEYAYVSGPWSTKPQGTED